MEFHLSGWMQKVTSPAPTSFNERDKKNVMNSIVFNEDCEIGLRMLPDNHFDLLIADIPYGINVGNMAYLKETKTTVRQKNGAKLNPRKNRNGKSYTLKDWDLKPPSQSYFDEARRVSRHQIIFGVEYVDWVGLGTGRIKWNKGVADGMSFKDYEMAYCSLINHTEEINLLWSGMMQAKSLYEPMTQQGNKKLNEKRLHPCHKPRLLYKKLLLDYATKGWLIGDTHLGAGSLRIEADLFGCDFMAWEIDEEYYNIQDIRFKEYKRQLTIF